MAKNKPASQTITDELINYLRARLETIFVTWRLQCEADTQMSSKRSFSREEFNDQVPILLNILLKRLGDEQVDVDAVAVAGEHGLHRWQSGYALIELARELEHLFTVILSEVDSFTQRNAERFDVKSLSTVHQQIFKLYQEANRGSIMYYHQLIMNDAGERARTLQMALDQVQQLSQQRGEHLRQSSHDIRASFSIMMIGSQLLELPASEKERTALMEMLNRNLSSIRDMLLQLTDYAKIEAGQDTLDISKFNVAELVKDALQNAAPVAMQQGLDLQGNGPDILEVETDRVKLQRILINLLHNALKHTSIGGIYITWAPETPVRWTLTVQDTGSGFAADSPSALLAEQLKPSLHIAAIHQKEEFHQEPPAPKSDSTPETKENEGLGLFIVKKLCELMKASMDIESIPGKGTLVRIRFVMHQESI